MMSGGKTYTIQFRTSSNRIATAKIRYQGGPLQGKELLRKIFVQYGVPHKYHDRMLKEFEKAVPLRLVILLNRERNYFFL